MVAQIAADVGLDSTDLLQGEVEALGKRLEDVKESIQTLADVAEARAQSESEYNENIVQTKSYLNDVQQVRHFFFHLIFFIGKFCDIKTVLKPNKPPIQLNNRNGVTDSHSLFLMFVYNTLCGIVLIMTYLLNTK